jgi:hypothetical protein
MTMEMKEEDLSVYPNDTYLKDVTTKQDPYKNYKKL